MKKVIKITVLFTVIAVLAVLLCSCQALDDLKSHQAYYTDDSHTKIEFSSKTFVGVDYTSGGKKKLVEYDSCYRACYATDKNIPTLFTYFGSCYYYDDDLTMLRYWSYNTEEQGLLENEIPNIYYIAEDCYDEFTEVYNSYDDLSNYMLMIRYDEEYFDHDKGHADVCTQVDTVLLNDELSKIIDKAKDGTLENTLSADVLSDKDSDIYYDCLICIYSCDENMLFYSDVEPFERLAILKDGSDYYLWFDSDYIDSGDFYKLPSSLNEYITDLFDEAKLGVSENSPEFYYTNHFG